jgi:hypothetical protein
MGIDSKHQCLACLWPLQIRVLTAPFDRRQLTDYFSRWFYCLNPECRVEDVYVEGYRTRTPAEAFGGARRVIREGRNGRGT